MQHISHRVGRINRPAGAASTAVLLAGCGLTSVAGQAGGQATGPAVTITQAEVPIALLAVTAGLASCRQSALLWLAPHGRERTSGSSRAGTSVKTIVASDSPAPAQVVIPGPPTAPGAARFRRPG